MTESNMNDTVRQQILVALGWIFLFVTQSGAGEETHHLSQVGKTNAIFLDAAAVSQVSLSVFLSLCLCLCLTYQTDVAFFFSSFVLYLSLNLASFHSE